MRPRGSRSGTGSASLQDDDAWSLSMEESRDAPVIEEMTRQLQLGSSGSTDQQPQRATKSHNPARPHSSRKSSSTSGIWSYLTGRQPSALESIHTETTQPRPGSSAEPRPSSQQGNSRSNTLPTTLQRSQSSRSRASSRSSAGHATGSTWIYLSDKADASSALRGKSVALLNQDEMAAAIRLNLAEILKGRTPSPR